MKWPHTIFSTSHVSTPKRARTRVRERVGENWNVKDVSRLRGLLFMVIFEKNLITL